MSYFRKRKQDKKRAIGITLMIGVGTWAFLLFVYLFNLKVFAQVDFKALSIEAQQEARQAQDSLITKEGLKDMDGVLELKKLAPEGHELEELEDLAAHGDGIEDYARQQVVLDDDLKQLYDQAATREKMDFDYENDPIFSAERQLGSLEEQNALLVEEFQDCTVERKSVGETFTDATCMSYAKREDVSCNKKLVYDCSKKTGADLTLISTPSQMPWSYNKNTGALRIGSPNNNFNSSHVISGNQNFNKGPFKTYYGVSKSSFNTKFNIKNLSDITSFLIATANFKEYTRISINGIQVYIGPNIKGSKLNIKSTLRKVSFTSGICAVGGGSTW